MARIRTVKPEFWEDEVVGLLSREARLLFIATFNLADDEGLLRWSASYIKATVFMYDDDLTIADVTKFMGEITDAGLLFPYVGGIARQQLAAVVNFRKHQRINRPQPGRMPAPSLQNRRVREMYARRDGWTCQLCKQQIPEKPVSNDVWNLSIDHIVPQSQGGSDYPSNLRATHQACNKGRGDRPDDDYVPPRSVGGGRDSLNDSVNSSTGDGFADGDDHDPEASNWSTQSENRSLNDSVNDSPTHSLPEGKGREGKGERGEPAPVTVGDQNPLSLITPDWQPTQDDIHAAQDARLAAGNPVLTGQQLAEVTRKFARRQNADARRAPASGWGARWQEWAERERPTDTGQTSILHGVPNEPVHLWPHEQASSGTASTPKPPSFAERMAELEGRVAADQAGAS
jgi:hypothetical protein